MGIRQGYVKLTSAFILLFRLSLTVRMEVAAGTLHRRGTSSYPVEARAGSGLRHRGQVVPLADRCGTWFGVAARRGGWLVGRVPLASSDALLSSRRGTGWGTWRGAGAVATLLGWVRVAVDVAVGLVRPPKGGLSCGGPLASCPVCLSSSPCGCGLDLADDTFDWCG